MANNQRSREERREEREAAEAKAQGADRRTRLLQLSAGGVFLAIIIVVVVIVVAGSGGGKSGGDASSIEHQAEVNKLIGGIPQHGLVLGHNNAPTTLYMYGDMQCSVCRYYIEEVLPEFIETEVREGKLKLIYRDFIIIGPESIPAGEAAISAGQQDKGWTYLQLFYHNQGGENAGYVTEEFLESVGKAAKIPDMSKWNKERKSGKYKSKVESTTEQAKRFGFTGTPSFAVEGPHSEGLELVGTPESTEALHKAIEKAA